MKLQLVLPLLALAQNAQAIDLNEQIKQNVDNAAQAYQKLVKEEPPKLWIHVRTDPQKQQVETLFSWLNGLNLVELQPLQKVKDGPKKTQLRFFTSDDKQRAELLLKKLQLVFPQVELLDFSAQFKGMEKLQQGHFELWLAPDVTTVVPPPPSAPENASPSVQ